jgi:diguanylate cyclase (GGDEF)-like protein/PAS domain S-box-containing protein
MGVQVIRLLRRAGRSVRRALPTGSSLPKDAWAGRHRAIVAILWAHVPALLIVGLSTHHGFGHSVMEASFVGFLAAGATLKRFDNGVRAALATIGLVVSSAILVHFSDGLIEMHFHFFVMVAIVTLYQSWTPFLLAIGFVVLHHGTVGVHDSSAVYNHAEAIADPWRWALIHGLFIAGASAAGLAQWKLNEIAFDSDRRARRALEGANAELGAAQAMSHIGSWDWTLVANEVWWSDELYRIMGRDPSEFTPTLEFFLGLICVEDRARVQEIVESSISDVKDFDYEARVVKPDGSICWIHALGAVGVGRAGNVVKISGTVQDITQRKALEAEIEHQAFHDSLTGLANRALFTDRLEHALLRRARAESCLAVLFMDLDDFKTVNDSMGHSAGDGLLVDVAHRIADTLRPADTVARFGGDELAILLEDLEGVDGAIAAAKRLTRLFKSPFIVNGTELSIHASIGIAYNQGLDKKSPGELLRDADIAMYEAKRSGKGSFEVFQTGMRVAATERLELKANLQQAVEDEEFLLHYQPIVDLVTGEVSGAEALVRWLHPDKGLVPPLDFIPFAEESGLILPIGRWVLEEACRSAASWSAAGLDSPPTVAVNLSGVRLRHPDLLQELTDVLDVTGLAPDRLILEITESVLVDDRELAVERFTELTRLGVKLAIDDFGTGYSSLSYLRDFPIDILKIDKSFIDLVALGPEDSALPRAVLKLAQTLNLKVVAEGVEGADQLAALQRLHCPFAQGYLFSKPVEGPSFEALLAGWDAAALAPKLVTA